MLRLGLRPQPRSVQIFQRPLENPRIIKRAAPNAHARATGFVQHHFRGLRRHDVAIADDGNIFYGFNHFADASQIYRAAKTLFACATVNKNRRDAGIFQRSTTRPGADAADRSRTAEGGAWRGRRYPLSGGGAPGKALVLAPCR